MATGIPPKDTIKRKKIAVRLSYDGKEESNTILNGKYQNFVTACSINGGGSNKFFFGDNLEALLFLLNNGYKGKISLIYIDPPFATSSYFVNRKQEHAYSDSLCGGEYIEFLRQRLIVMRELLSDKGSIYLQNGL